MKIIEKGAFENTGAVHKNEIASTLQKLERELDLDLQNNTLGSAGKKEFSGDIDVAVDVSQNKLSNLVEKLKKSSIVKEVKKSSVVMTRVAIENYQEDLKTDKPRTGYVQVDFMPGEVEWMKTFYHSPSEHESKQKGVHRNLLITAIVNYYDRKDSKETTNDARPLESFRWLWSPQQGLVKVSRTPKPKKNGKGYTKQNVDRVVLGPFKKADEIVEKLGLDSKNDLNSYESLKQAIEKNYPQNLVNKIMIHYKNDPSVQKLGVPGDLQEQQENTINQ